MQRLAERPELLDGPLDDSAELRGNLRDLRRVNRWFGGTALSRSALVALATRFHHDPRVGRMDWRDRPVTMLDIGTGSADIPLALIGWTTTRHFRLRVEAIDQRHEIMDVARELTGAATVQVREAITLQVAGGPPLPYPDGAFDVSHMSLVAHHLEPEELYELLLEMRRVSRVGVIVNDLHRGRLLWLGAWLLCHLGTRNRLTRNDAPLSVRRAYRAPEVAQMATRAGLLEAGRFRGFLGHRYAIALVPSLVASSEATAGEPET